MLLIIVSRLCNFLVLCWRFLVDSGYSVMNGILVFLYYDSSVCMLCLLV